jgi:hypothetical protein
MEGYMCTLPAPMSASYILLLALVHYGGKVYILFEEQLKNTYCDRTAESSRVSL